MSRIVLASASPRRKALLEALGLEVEVVVSNAPETLDGPPSDMVVVNARAKRDTVVAQLDSPAMVVAADTIVVLEDRVLPKPADLDEARTMLARLSGNTHEVLTGVALVDTATGRHAQGVETTRVTFRVLAEDEIERFVLAVRPLDRAGAYTVDGPGSLLVSRYEGCYQNVLGLPMARLDTLLRETGHSLFEQMDGDRAVFL